MRRKKKKLIPVIAAATGLGVVAGLRAVTAPAVLSWAANRGWMHGRATMLSGRGALKATSALALAEIVADKTPYVRERTALPSLAARIASGSLVGAALCVSKRKPWAFGMLAGAFGAVVGTFAGFHLRKRLSAEFPDRVIAVTEDAIAIGGGALLLKVA